MKAPLNREIVELQELQKGDRVYLPEEMCANKMLSGTWRVIKRTKNCVQLSNGLRWFWFRELNTKKGKRRIITRWLGISYVYGLSCRYGL